MGAAFGKASAVDDMDSIRIEDSCQTVCDDDGCAALGQLGERALYGLLRLAVERRGRLIEKDNRRVSKKGAGNRDPLPLAAGKLTAQLADLRLVAGGQALDEMMRIGCLGCGDECFISRIFDAGGDIVAYCPVKQKDVLAHERDIAAQRMKRYIAKVLRIDHDRT